LLLLVLRHDWRRKHGATSGRCSRDDSAFFVDAWTVPLRGVWSSAARTPCRHLAGSLHHHLAAAAVAWLCVSPYANVGRGCSGSRRRLWSDL